jgi:hypothetical protein
MTIMHRFLTLDQFSFHHTLAEQPGLCLVIFTSRACASCRRWKRLLANYVERGEEPAIEVFEVDAERDLGLVREFEVFHLPALFLYREGRYHCELQSEARPEKFAAAIRTGLASPRQEAP